MFSGIVGIALGIGLLVYWNDARSKLSSVSVDVRAAQSAQSELSYMLYLGIAALVAGVVYLVLALMSEGGKSKDEGKPAGPAQ
jgi:uncharacterized membrane protein HdeD (DUF308 family)